MPIALILRVVTLENQQIRSKACGHSPCICTPPGASILRHGQHKFHSYHQRLCSWVLMAQQKDCSINSQDAIEEKGQPPLHSSSQRKKEPRWILDLSFYLASDSAFLQLQTQRKHFYYTTPWRLETHKRELRTSKGISGGSRPKNVSKKRTDEMKARHGCYRRRRATANGDGRRPAAAAPLVGMGISIGEDTKGVHPSRAPQAAAAAAAGGVMGRLTGGRSLARPVGRGAMISSAKAAGQRSCRAGPGGDPPAGRARTRARPLLWRPRPAFLCCRWALAAGDQTPSCHAVMLARAGGSIRVSTDNTSSWDFCTLSRTASGLWAGQQQHFQDSPARV